MTKYPNPQKRGDLLVHRSENSRGKWLQVWLNPGAQKNANQKCDFIFGSDFSCGGLYSEARSSLAVAKKIQIYILGSLEREHHFSKDEAKIPGKALIGQAQFTHLY